MDRIGKLKTFLMSSPGDSFLQHALALEYVKMGMRLKQGDYLKKYWSVSQLILEAIIIWGSYWKELAKPEKLLSICEGNGRIRKSGR
jgi:hypothetical protein